MAQEAGVPFFDGPSCNWSEDQIQFSEWLIFYHRIYNIPDGPPPQEVIDNDDKLDKWLIEYNLKKKAERITKGGKPTSARDHKNVINFSRKR